MDEGSEELSRLIIDEIIASTSLKANRLTRALFWPFFHGVTDSLAALLGQFDEIVAEKGLPSASAWMLMHFCKSIRVQGSEKIPKEGPLLLASNHPGAYDGLIAFSCLKRNDILWISNDIPAFHLVKHTQKHVAYASKEDPSDHFLVMRRAMHHLRDGGALFYLASGGRDPDPGVFGDAESYIDRWLDTFDAFYRYVPELKVQPVVIGEILSPYWANHPITKLGRDRRLKMILAEFGQIIHQLTKPGKTMTTPAISFGKAYSATELKRTFRGLDTRSALIRAEKDLLRAHLESFPMMVR